MSDQLHPTIEHIIGEIDSKSRGRTRYEGQADYWDERLVAEIRRLTERVEELDSIGRELLTIAECDANTPENAGVIVRAQSVFPPAAAEGGEPDIGKCPNCGGPADNGFSREVPPAPYYCTKCSAEDADNA